MSLNAEQRLKVAKACIPYDYGAVPWEPLYSELQRLWIVTRIAELIYLRSNNEPTIGYLIKFNKALATGYIDGLEQLCFELIGDGDAPK